MAALELSKCSVVHAGVGDLPTSAQCNRPSSTCAGPFDALSGFYLRPNPRVASFQGICENFHPVRPLGGFGLYGVAVVEMNRRDMMLMTGAGMLAAAIPLPEARAVPSRPDAPPGAEAGSYVFQDEFDGPAGAGPDPGKWIVWNWDEDVYPPVLSHYRDDRRNVFLDGNSNLVIRATHEDSDYF